MRWAFCATLLVALPAAGRPLPSPRSPAAAPSPPVATTAPRAALPAPTELLPPEERLARGRQSYLNNDFDGTIDQVRGLLYPEVQLRSEEAVQSAHRLLALSYFLSRRSGHEEAAERELLALLALRPDFALDPVVDPPQAIAFLDRLRVRERQRLEEFERRRREAGEAAARAQEEKRRQEEDRRIAEAVERELKLRRPTIERHVRALCFVPFGIGQFQNGEDRKGRAFLGTQLTLAALEIGLWVGLETRYGVDGRVPASEAAAARALWVGAAVVGGLFWVDVAWGVIDALVKFRPEVVRVAPPTPRASLAPFLLPSGGGGLSLQGAF